MSNWSQMPFTQIDVLRHGACEGGEIFRGSTDVALSESGWQQMHQSVEGLHWDHIISSPLRRCHEFSKTLAAQLAMPLSVDARWREFDFGRWEGQLREKIWREQGEDVTRFFANPATYTPEGGDSYDSVRERVQSAWDEILLKYEGKKVLVVAHGGIIRVLFAVIHSLPTEGFNSVEVPYACLSRWKHYQGSPRAMLAFHHRQKVD